MKNIHILPTDQPSRIHKNIDGEIGLTNIVFRQEDGVNQNQYIYITSDEEIKVGDYVLDIVNAEVMISKGKMFDNPYIKKIILTTDTNLIADGVQAIDDDFLKWFIKNPSCDFIEVKEKSPNEIEKELGIYGHDIGLTENEYSEWLKNGGQLYKIIIPQEGDKQEGYICPHTKIQCDDECCVSAKDCHITSSLASGIVEPKQRNIRRSC